jgi:ribonuclease R
MRILEFYFSYMFACQIGRFRLKLPISYQYNKKEMPKLTLETVKENLKGRSRPVKIRELSRIMGVATPDYPAFRKMIKEAVSSGQLSRLRGGRLAIEPKKNLIQGKLIVSRAGHGFVMPQNKSGEIFISPRDMNGALHGEEVRVSIKDSRAGKNREGRIVEVLDREKGRLVGKVVRNRYGYYIVPEDRRISGNIEVDNPQNLALDKDLLVTVRLYPWESAFLPPRGHVEEILGKAGTPGIDIDSLIIGYGFPKDFDPDVKPELAKIRRAIPKAEIARRVDMRDLAVFTIDPVDAKDHDDAVSLEPLGQGVYRLGVHIADVSHYVKETTMLDREARMRGNSVYLVDRVIPMLPPKLSSDICSLVEDEDRLTVSFICEIDDEAGVRNWRFAETIIRSSASLTYEEVQDHFDHKGKGRIEADWGKMLNNMLKISKALRQERLSKGSLDFDLPEPTVRLDPEGKVLDIFTQARMPSHLVVEEFMLVANKYAATYLASHAIPILYRVHGHPDKEKIENFGALLREMGYDISLRGDITPKKLQHVLELVKGKPEEAFVEKILLRSLAKAVYQPENIGHFGLAFPMYTHFTSPIRRYPDLLVHRALKLFLKHKFTSDVAKEQHASLKAIGLHCTTTEIAADEAERDSIKLKQLEFLSERVGGVYDGNISGVVKSGMFVELAGSMVEGFVAFATIKDDYFMLDEGKHRATGRKTGRTYKLGDKVRVIVVKVDLENKRSDFVLVNDTEEKREKRKKKKK